MDLKDIKIGVLGGGVSAEREISLISAQGVHEALSRSGLKAVFLDIITSDPARVKVFIKSFNLDLAFIALHGEFGEDGRLQQALDELNIPYTGSCPEASFLAMDKSLSKKIFIENKINTPSFQLYSQSESISQDQQYPIVVKPHFSGSSLGTSIVKKSEDLGKAVDKAFSCSDKVIIEEYISGREMSLGILDEKPLSIVEIVPLNDYYDFEAKYKEGGSRFICPANLDQKVYQAIQEIGLSAHKALGCRHFSRVDLRLNQENLAYVLEINSIPGLTSHSLLPLSARSCGMNFDQLILTMLNLAFNEKKIAQKV